MLLDVYRYIFVCHFRRNRDAQLRATINQKLIETGERDRCIDVFLIYFITRSH